MRFVPFKIISGCETGADRSGLDAARANAIPIGGNMPAGGMAEDGPIAPHYGLTPASTAEPYPPIEMNAMHSDATVIMHMGLITGGTLFTLDSAKKHCKPALLVDVREGTDASVKKIEEFLETVKPAVLNIGGPRESKAPGLYRASYAILEKCFAIF